MLSDTADALEEKGQSLLQLNDARTYEHAERHRRCNIVTTIEKSSYSMMHQNVVEYLHHWVDLIYMIRPLQGDVPAEQKDTAWNNSSEWELTCKQATTEHEVSLKFSVKLLKNRSVKDYDEPLHEISWISPSSVASKPSSI